MKLIIDIPEDIYKDIIENGFIYDEDNEIVTDVIKDGTPLDNLRAEITEYKDDQIIHAERNEIIDIVLGIIDKYRERSE